MNNQKPVELSPEAQKALQAQAVKAKADELTNLSRLVVNTLNLICSNDVQIPSAYAQPVAEIQTWLTGMHKNIQTQLETVQGFLPASNVATVEERAKRPMVDAATPNAAPLEVVGIDTPAAPEAPKA